MDSNQGYLSRAWHDLTQDPKWWQPILILSLVSFIPIVGNLFVAGYLLDWAREGAWGMSRGFTHKMGNAAKRLKWGFFAVVIAICWTLPVSIIGSCLSILPLIGVIIYIASYVLTLILSVIATSACVRMSIYDKIGAGLQFTRIWNMARQDASGLARCFFISLLKVVPVIIAIVIICAISIPLMLAGGMGSYAVMSNPSDADAMIALVSAITGGGLLVVIIVLAVLFVAVVAYTACEALAYRSYGYWVAQFEPAKWNGVNDPMPFEPGYVERKAPAQPHAADAQASEAEQGSSFAKTVDAAAAAVTAAGTAAVAAADKVADKAAQAAQGFKTEPVGQKGEASADNEPIVVEAKVAEVQGAAVADAADKNKETVSDEGAKLAAIYREAYDKAHGDGDVADSDSATPEPAEQADEAQGQETQESVCPSCGAPVSAAHKFCTNCGTKLQ